MKTIERKSTDARGVLTLFVVSAFMSFLALTCANGQIDFTSSEDRVLAYLRDLPFEGDGGGRLEHLSEVARAVTDATELPSERAWLLGLGNLESTGFTAAVCSGEKLGDGGKAFGCWQSWDPDRSGGIAGQAKRALRRLHLARGECRAAVRRGDSPSLLHGMVSNYATGRPGECNWSGAPPYVKAIQVAHGRIAK